MSKSNKAGVRVLITSTSFGKRVREPLDMLVSKGYEIVLNDLARPLREAELIERLDGIDGCIAGLDEFTGAAIRSARALKVISRYGSGLDNVDLAAAAECEVAVTNTPDANSDSVADLAVGLMLAVGRRIVAADRCVHEGRWDKMFGSSLHGKTVGIIGFGRIGQRVAERLRGFRCSILVSDPVRTQSEAAECGVCLRDLESVLRDSDFVSLHLPLSEDTRHMLDTQRIAMMKESAFLINTSRGELVDQSALLSALRSGALGGAGLDAYAVEPPDPEEFAGLTNVVLTPHMGAYSDEALMRMGIDSVENLCAVLDGCAPNTVRDSMELLIGLDLGTTGIKAAAFDTSGEEVVALSAPNPVTTGADGSHFVEADELVDAVRKLLTEMEDHLGRRFVSAIGMSSAMFTVLPVDGHGSPLGPSRTWADTTIDSTVDVAADVDFYFATGCRTHPIYPRVKIRKTLEERPDLTQSAAMWVSLPEFVFYKLTGTWAVSKSIASSSGLLDIHSLYWRREALEWAGIALDRLSPIVEESFCAVIEDGPFAGVPLAIGATDGPLCHYGTGSVGVGEMTSTIGTSGALRLLSPAPRLDPLQRTWCYYLTGENWVVGGATNCGAVALDWLVREIIGKQDETASVVRRAMTEVPAGSQGLTFLPEIIGERSPGWDPALRGAIYGLSLSHNRLHLVRSVLEGITFRMRAVFDATCAVASSGDLWPVSRIRATGGYTRSRQWLQMQADVFGTPIETVSVSEAAAFGAACLAAEGSGVCSAEELSSTVTATSRISPQPELAEVYAEAMARSERLCDLVRQGFGSAQSTAP